MASMSDVESAISAMLLAALYPAGIGYQAVVGAPVRIMRGWPTEAQIDAAIGSGVVLVSVFGDKGMTRDTTRYFWNFQGSSGTPTITVTLAGNIVTFAGTVATGHGIAIQCGGVWFPYTPVSADTLSTIATAFAGLIPGSSASGPILTLPALSPSPQTRVVMSGGASITVSSQQAGFKICVWASTDVLRDQVFAQLPGFVAYLGSRLTLPDGSTATWRGQTESGPMDQTARAGEWRKDVVATYEFDVLYTQTQAALLLLEAAIASNAESVQSDADLIYPTVVLTDGNGNPLTDPAGTLLGNI